MPKSSVHASEAVIHIEPPGALKTLSLTSNQLERWCATIEKDNNPNKNTEPYLALQFLSRYGLKNPRDVIEFLKSDAGKTTIALIREELLRIEELNNSLAQQAREEALMRERMVVFILMGAIAQREEQAKQVAEITQQQNEQRLKETKPSESTTKQATPIEVLDANIKCYTEAIKVLDIKQAELEKELKAVEDQLKIIEVQVAQITQHHANFNAHMDQLNAVLQLSLLLQPGMNYTAHATQQIESLTTQLAALRVQNAARNIISGADPTDPDRESNVSRRIRVLEEQLAFHQNLLKQPTLSEEQVQQQLIEQAEARISERGHAYESQTTPHPHRSEMECLGLQFLQVLRKERILLDDQFEPVTDFTKACFIIDPSQRSRYRRQGDSYGIFSEDVDQTKTLSESDWLQARLNFDRVRPDIRVIHMLHNEQTQQQLSTLQERRQHQHKIKDEFISKIENIKCSKVEALKALTSAKNQKELLLKNSTNPQNEARSEQSSSERQTLAPKPSPKLTPKRPESESSYSLMMTHLDCFAQKPSPRKKDIQEIRSELESIVPSSHQEALTNLIQEVHPDIETSLDTRIEWMQRAKKLIPRPRPDDTSDTELDLDFSTGFGNS